MRNLLTSLCVASILIFAGCDERQSMKVAQDKQGHAYTPEGGQPGGGGMALIAGEDEQYITTGARDTLTSVAKKYNTTLAWLIKRNQLKEADKYKDGVPPGTNLIVPKLDAKR